MTKYHECFLGKRNTESTCRIYNRSLHICLESCGIGLNRATSSRRTSPSFCFTRTRSASGGETRGEITGCSIARAGNSGSSAARTRSRRRSCSRSFPRRDAGWGTCARTTSTWRTSARERSPRSRQPGRTRSSTAPSTGCTRRSSACVTASGGAPVEHAVGNLLEAGRNFARADPER